MKFTVMPKTSAGKWAGRISLVFIILMALKFLLPVPLPSIAIFALELVGFGFSIAAIARKDHSLGVYLSFLLGAAIFIWTVAEIAFPH